MPTSIFGLPLHPLIVHATAVIVPLAALLVILAVAWPRFRAWAGPLPMGFSLAALILTPLSTASGENLEKTVKETALVERHAELGEQLLPFTIALFVLSAAFWWLDRRRVQELAAAAPTATHLAPASSGTATATLTAPTRTRTTPWLRTATAAVGVLALLAAIGTGIQVARIGHSGAKAAWSAPVALLR